MWAMEFYREAYGEYIDPRSPVFLALVGICLLAAWWLTIRQEPTLERKLLRAVFQAMMFALCLGSLATFALTVWSAMDLLGRSRAHLSWHPALGPAGLVMSGVLLWWLVKVEETLFPSSPTPQKD